MPEYKELIKEFPMEQVFTALDEISSGVQSNMIMNVVDMMDEDELIKLFEKLRDLGVD